MLKYWMVGIGGFLGSILRFWASGYFGERFGSRFPLGTLLINCTGSFLIGLVATFLAHRTHWDEHWTYLIPIGFIGGYTTFSAFEYETFRHFQNGEVLVAGLNVTLSVTVGFVAVWLGVVTGKAMS